MAELGDILGEDEDDEEMLAEIAVRVVSSS